MAISWNVGSVFEIVSIGDAEMLTAALNGLAAITGSDSFTNMMRVAFLIGILAFAVRVVMTGKFEAVTLLASFLVFMVMFAPKATVVVVDGYNGTVRNVANVPIGLAAPFSIVSKTGRYFTSTFEQAFTVIGPASQFSGAGYLDALSVLLRMRDANVGIANSDDTNNGNFASSLQNYLTQCAFFDIELASPPDSIIVPEKLKKAGDIWPELRTNFLNIQTTVFPPSAGIEGIVLSCKDAYNQISADYFANPGWKAGPFDDYLKVVIQQSAGIDSTASDRISGALGAINASSTDAATYAINSVLYNQLRKAEANYAASRGDTNATIIATQAEAQRNVQWTAERTMFEKVARPVTAFIEVFLVAATPLMAFAIAAFGMAGVSTLGKFMLLHFWVTLWTPTLAIANMYTYTVVNRYMDYMHNQTNKIADFSMLGMDHVTMELQNQFAAGSMLAAATPMLTLMLIYGSSQVASMMAQKMSSADQVDAKIASPSVVSPGALVQNSSAFSGNPVGGVGHSVTGATAMSSTLSNIAIKSESSNQAVAQEAIRTFGETASRGYKTADGVSFGLKSSNGRDWTTSAGGENLFTAGLSTSLNATSGMKLGVERSSALSKAFSEETSSGQGIGFDTRKIFGLGGGAQFDMKAATAWGERHGLTTNEAQEFAQNVSKQASTANTSAAKFSNMTSSNGQVMKDFAVSNTSSKDDGVAFTRSLADSMKATDSYMQAQSWARNVAGSTTWTPSQLDGNIQTLARHSGTNADAAVNSAWSQSFGNNPQMQQQKLAAMMSNPAFQDNVSNPADRERAAKAWIMANDQQANATHLIMAGINPGNIDNARRADPTLNSQLQSSAPKPGAVQPTVQAQVPASQNTIQAVNATVAKGQADGQQLGKQIRPVTPKDAGPAQAAVDAALKANFTNVSEGAKADANNMIKEQGKTEAGAPNTMTFTPTAPQSPAPFAGTPTGGAGVPSVVPSPPTPPSQGASQQPQSPTPPARARATGARSSSQPPTAAQPTSAQPPTASPGTSTSPSPFGVGPTPTYSNKGRFNENHVYEAPPLTNWVRNTNPATEGNPNKPGESRRDPFKGKPLVEPTGRYDATDKK